MAAVTAAMVKELRERTGLGMMECKKALVEADGDIEKAIDDMRKSGQAKAAKKAGRTAAEGGVVIATNDANTVSVMVEINSKPISLPAMKTSWASATKWLALLWPQVKPTPPRLAN